MTRARNQDGLYSIFLCSSDAMNCNGNKNLRRCAAQVIGKQPLLYAKNVILYNADPCDF